MTSRNLYIKILYKSFLLVFGLTMISFLTTCSRHIISSQNERTSSVITDEKKLFNIKKITVVQDDEINGVHLIDSLTRRDTMTYLYDTSGINYLEIGNYKRKRYSKVDSVFYNYRGRDTLPDWTIITYKDQVVVDTMTGFHVFDNLGFLKEEILTSSVSWTNYKKHHFYDEDLSYIGYEQYYNNGQFSAKLTEIHFDSLQLVVRTKMEYHRNGEKYSHYIDSIWSTDANINRIKKWADISLLEIYTAPNCFICQIDFKYDDKGRLIHKITKNIETNEVKERLYLYHDGKDFTERKEIAMGDTVIYLMVTNYDIHLNVTEHRTFKDGVMIKWIRRFIAYWP